MFTDAANIIFTYAKRRCYTMSDLPKKSASAQPTPAHDIDDEYAWAILDEMERRTGDANPTSARTKTTSAARQSKERPYAKKKWLPEAMDPVLEELPKWKHIADVLQEIEEEMIRRQSQLSSREPSFAVTRFPSNYPRSEVIFPFFFTSSFTSHCQLSPKCGESGMG